MMVRIFESEVLISITASGKRKMQKKHFAAEHYISTLENYQKRYERACKYENEPAIKEVLADIQGLLADYHSLSAKDYLGKNKFFVRECV